MSRAPARARAGAGPLATRMRRPASPPRGSARSRAWRASNPGTPSTSSAGSGSSPSSWPGSSAWDSSASSARRAAASRRSSGPGSSRPSQTGSCRAARAGGVGCFDPASARSRHFARCSRRRPRIRLQKRSTRCPRTRACSSRSTSWRSCSPPAATTTSGRPSPASSLARLPIRPVAPVVVVAFRADFYGRFAAYPGARRAARREPRAGRADAGLGAAPRRRVARRTCRAARGAGAVRCARRRRRRRAGRTAAAVDGAARALAEATRPHALARGLPRFRRRPRRRRAAGGGHVCTHSGGHGAARARR